MRISLIVTAAGASSRFLQTLPAAAVSRSPKASKLFFELGGMAVLERTLKAFQTIPQIKEVLVTVQSGQEKKAKAWARLRGLRSIKWIPGGKTRAESVWQALKKTAPQNAWVMVHDGARPLIEPQTIRKMIQSASRYDVLLLAKRVVPTLKKISADGRVEATVDRTHLAEAETPQIARRKNLMKAYRSLTNAFSFTDEAGLIEAAGGRAGVYLHTDWNPKLTHFSDYQLAQAKLEAGVERRIGKGYDIHRLVPGRRLWVGGIRVPFEKGSLGHSDGDALLHSITDAVLGALGWGDIGDWFSDKSAKYKNIASAKLLTQVLEKVREKGWAVEQMDCNVILEKPKLGLFKTKIRAHVAKLLNLPAERVSIKARTFEGLFPIGTGDAWVCESFVMMKKGNVI